MKTSLTTTASKTRFFGPVATAVVLSAQALLGQEGTKLSQPLALPKPVTPVHKYLPSQLEAKKEIEEIVKKNKYSVYGLSTLSSSKCKMV